MMFVTLSEILIFERLSQSLKASCPMSVTLLPIVTSFSERHCSNAWLPIVVIALPMVTLSRPS